MDAVKKLGELQRIHQDSQDVTEEFYDVRARLANKRVEEARLIAHLKQSTSKLTDILAVERELSRVREEIERMEGRLRVLTDQTDLTTVTVSIQEVQRYIPAERTAFGAMIGRTFRGSLNRMGDLARAIVLAIVALAPWLLVGLLLGYPLWLLLRRGWGRPPAP